jgi:hypothetical protein
VGFGGTFALGVRIGLSFQKDFRTNVQPTIDGPALLFGFADQLFLDGFQLQQLVGVLFQQFRSLRKRRAGFVIERVDFVGHVPLDFFAEQTAQHRPEIDAFDATIDETDRAGCQTLVDVNRVQVIL